MSDTSEDNDIDQNSRCNPKPISPIILIKTKNFKSYRRPKYRNIGANINVWPKCLWFDPECDRQKAESILRNARNGSFIIRKSSGFNRNGSHAMSLAFNNNVYHCLINKYSDGFGFDTKRVFTSLEDLVLHYKEYESLNVHNRLLNSYLVIPGLKSFDNKTYFKY